MTQVSPRLKVVASDPLAGFEPKFISTVEDLDGYWPQVSALLEPVVTGAMRGEMDTADIYKAVREGRMYCLVAKDDSGEVPEVALVLILELVAYPQKTLLNVTAIGGRELNLLQSRFWKHVCSWAYMSGVREMQAMVSPAMARIISKFGFEHVYQVMRMPLTEI